MREKKREKQRRDTGTNTQKAAAYHVYHNTRTILQRRVQCSLLFALCGYIYTYTPIEQVSNALSSHLQD